MNTYFKNALYALLVITSSSSFAGLVDVSKIVITASTLNTQGWLQISEIIATETATGDDLALSSMGATAIGSSNWSGSDANFAIDGIAPAPFPQIFHSNENDASTFLSIDLASPSELDSITLFGRVGCCSFRDIYNIMLLDSNGALLFQANDLDATGTSHSVSIGLPNTASNNVPEPAALMMMGLGLIGFSLSRKRK